ncbi:ferritin [Puniceicoccaceae bacterium K14]|nr:ferritin [Puniceicoccaceae bacterium K14]
MNLTPELEKALNDQLGKEFFASYSYLSMAAYFDGTAWDGFGSWMTLQSDEERAHAMKFYTYILDRGGKVKLPEIQAPRIDFKDPLDVFKTSLSQEKDVTKSISNLYKLALESADFATVSFLQWFVDEQVEEEKNVSDMIDKLERAGSNPENLLLLDNYAGKRSAEPAE